jgi:quinoprotein glucose dehydrogenase
MNQTPIIPFVAAVFAFGVATASAQFQTFEGDGFGDWQTTGDAFGLSPVHGKLDGMGKSFSGFSNDAFAASVHGGNEATGMISSSEFEIKQDYILFLVAGGKEPGKTAVQLLVDGEVTMEATGNNGMRFERIVWNVAKLKGKKAFIRAVDESKGEWGFIAIDHLMLTGWANEKFPSATKNGKLFAEGLISTPALAGATIPEGSSLKIEATYEEHKITSPTALTFDDQGNVYVSETHRFRHGVEDDRNHLYWYLDDLQAQKTEDRRALHKKWEKKLSHEYMTEVSEVIRRLSDTDGDGTIDDSKVFADGFNDVLDGTAAGVFYYDGAIYFACIPKIYKLLDTDGDGVADKRDVIEEGFGVRISLSGHDLNGFTLGPDGRIYGTVGDRGFSVLTKAGKEYHYPNEGAAFRFEPDGSGFELMHTGLRNPKEIAFDEFGNAFTVDNNSDQGDEARIVYLVEGGESGWQMEHQAMHTFHRQIGLEKRPPSRWMDEKMWELRNDTQPAYILPPAAYLSSGPSGLTYHPGTGFLESEKGRFLICDYKGAAAVSGIWSFAMQPDGAGMIMQDARKFNWGVAATDVEYSFDGRVFVTDFVTGWQSHEAGRLLSLDAGENLYLPNETREAAKLISEGFDQRSSAELGKLLGHADSRVRLRAQIALTRKADAIGVFAKAAKSDQLLERIHGIWGLGIVARRGSVPSPTGNFSVIPKKGLREAAVAALIPFLKDMDPEIRVQALRAIADAPVSGDSLPLAALLEDNSLRVQFATAIAIGKMKALGHYSAVLDLLKKNNNRDLYIRHAGIYALQHIVTDPYQIGALATMESPAVRLAAVVALRRMNSGEVARFINDPDPKVQDEAIRAIGDLDMVQMRPLVAALLDDIGVREWTPFILRRLVNNAYRCGTPEDAERILKVIANPKLPAEVREEALRLVGIWEEPHPVDTVTAHYWPLEKRPLGTLKPALAAALPNLLKGDGFILTGALELIEKYHLDVAGLNVKTLLDLIGNDTNPVEARSMALILYIERAEPELADFLISTASDESDMVALTALEALTKIDSGAALGALEKAIETGSANRAQKAWTILATLPGDEAAGFIVSYLNKLLEAEGVSPSGIELLAAAGTREEDSVKDALAAYEKHFAESEDPLAKFNIALEGGDAKNGLSLFNSHPAGQCMRCHKPENEGHSAGGGAGPNLAGIGKLHDREYLLESVINPGAVVAPGYGITSVIFKNGASLGGNLIEETPDNLVVSTPDKTWSVKRSDIASFTPPVSAMPPMALLLQPSEIRDLVAWLVSLDKKSAQVKFPEPELLDPSTLPGAK